MEETTTIDYTTASADQLLAALDQAGRTPDRALLEACLARRDDLVPGLLHRLEQSLEPEYGADWGDNDPRWYGDIHAGRFLIAFREEKALPIFEEILRADEDGVAIEWFESALPSYGPAILPMGRRLIPDASVFLWVRISGIQMLKAVAQLHPDAAPDVIATLRAALPPLTERGDPDVPDEVDEDQMVLWTFAVLALAELGDAASQPQAEALHDWDLIDETVYGDYEAYQDIQASGDDPAAPPSEFDLLRVYAQQARVDQGILEPSEPVEAPSEDDPAYPIGYGSTATFVREEPKVGRNDPCPCGSGKKFKKCCGRR
jgi:hypothetical protein